MLVKFQRLDMLHFEFTPIYSNEYSSLPFVVNLMVDNVIWRITKWEDVSFIHNVFNWKPSVGAMLTILFNFNIC